MCGRSTPDPPGEVRKPLLLQEVHRAFNEAEADATTRAGAGRARNSRQYRVDPEDRGFVRQRNRRGSSRGGRSGSGLRHAGSVAEVSDGNEQDCENRDQPSKLRGLGGSVSCPSHCSSDSLGSHGSRSAVVRAWHCNVEHQSPFSQHPRPQPGHCGPSPAIQAPLRIFGATPRRIAERYVRRCSPKTDSTFCRV